MNSWCRASGTAKDAADLDLAHSDPGGTHLAPPDAARPDPSLLPAPELPMALLGALRRFGPAWLRWMGAHVGVGITPARLQLLGALAASHAPQIMRQLTTVLGTTPRAVTSLVDGLEADGLVARSAHPTDRRATLVSLTARGRDLTQQRHAQGVLAAARVFDVLPESDQRTLLRILQTLTDALTTPR